MKVVRLVIVMIPTFWSCQDAEIHTGHHHHDRPNPGNHQFEKLISEGNRTPAQPQRSYTNGFQLNGSRTNYFDPGSDILALLTYNKNQATIEESRVQDHAKAHLESIWPQLGFDFKDQLQVAEKAIIKPTDSLLFVSFIRIHGGYEVEDSLIQVVYFKTQKGYRLREVKNLAFGPIPSLPLNKMDPISSEELQIQTGIGTLKLESQQPKIVVHSKPFEPYQFELASVIQAYDPEADTQYTITFGDENGELIEAYEHKWSAGIKLQANIFSRSYVYENKTAWPLGYVEAADKRADKDGIVRTDLSSFELALEGKYTKLFDDGRALGSITVTPQDGVVTIDPSRENLPAVNAYVAVNRVVDYVRNFISDEQVPELSNGLDLRTNVNLGGSCNAFYSGRQRSINFYSAGGGCGNTALINEIVYHEWGHALDDFTGTRQGIMDSAFSEGIGDIVGMFITEDNVTGRGIEMGSTSGVRDLDNNLTYPSERNQIHFEGQIIGGTFWDLRKNLMTLQGRRGHNLAADLFFKHILTTDSYLNSYQTVVTLNDDDGDPDTRSPHFCAINRAFAKHNLADYVDCMDLDRGFKIRIDSPEGTSKLTIRASHPGATTLLMCPGRVDSCSPRSSGAILFEKVAEAGDSYVQNIYDAERQAEVDVEEEDTYTMFSLDENDNLVGYKTLSFVENTDEI